MDSLIIMDFKLQETLITLVAAGLTTFSFIPQAVRTIRLRETKDLSMTMYLMMSIGVAFWLFLGLMYMNYVMIAANGICLVLNLIILRLKLKFG
tara:strand:+ start:177 stop:458 length:282 start_codon:yes stop_codon:yes gene_type:complete